MGSYHEAAVKNTFDYELSTIAEALYETPELLHEAQKSTLADSLRSLVDQNTASISSENVRFVLDGGALLHRIPWSRGSSFESILSTYGNFVSKNYGEAIIVFEGYKAFTTKDMTHKRRSKGKNGVCISFDRDMNLTVTKEVFLSNSQNKQRFINFLGETLEVLGCTVFHDSADTDLLIVQKAVESASSMETVLVGDDTDLLVPLIHHVPLESKDIFFASERKKNSKGRVWNIKKVKAGLGPLLCKLILFSHTVLGCDTTSQLFGIGKGSILKKIKQNNDLQQAAKVFDNPHSRDCWRKGFGGYVQWEEFRN